MAMRCSCYPRTRQGMAWMGDLGSAALAGHAAGAPRRHDGRHLDPPPRILRRARQQERSDEIRRRPVHIPKQLHPQAI